MDFRLNEEKIQVDGGLLSYVAVPCCNWVQTFEVGDVAIGTAYKTL